VDTFFLEKFIVFENLGKAPESSLLLGNPRHIAYNQKYYVIRLKTDNWQYATKLIAEN